MGWLASSAHLGPSSVGTIWAHSCVCSPWDGLSSLHVKSYPLEDYFGFVFMAAGQGSKRERRHARPSEGPLSAGAPSFPMTSYWPKQVTSWPRFQRWGSSFQLLAGGAAGSHCKG